MILKDPLQEFNIVMTYILFYNENITYIGLDNYVTYTTNNLYDVATYFNAVRNLFGYDGSYEKLFLQCYGELILNDVRASDRAKKQLLKRLYGN